MKHFYLFIHLKLFDPKPICCIVKRRDPISLGVCSLEQHGRLVMGTCLWKLVNHLDEDLKVGFIVKALHLYLQNSRISPTELHIACILHHRSGMSSRGCPIQHRDCAHLCKYGSYRIRIMSVHVLRLLSPEKSN